MRAGEGRGEERGVVGQTNTEPKDSKGDKTLRGKLYSARKKTNQQKKFVMRCVNVDAQGGGDACILFIILANGVIKEGEGAM